MLGQAKLIFGRTDHATDFFVMTGTRRDFFPLREWRPVYHFGAVYVRRQHVFLGRLFLFNVHTQNREIWPGTKRRTEDCVLCWKPGVNMRQGCEGWRAKRSQSVAVPRLFVNVR